MDVVARSNLIMGHPHREIMITIRVDSCLANMLKGIPNRSAFIRDAILDALARQCPACHGAGILAVAARPDQEKASEKSTGQQAPDEA